MNLDGKKIVWIDELYYDMEEVIGKLIFSGAKVQAYRDIDQALEKFDRWEDANFIICDPATQVAELGERYTLFVSKLPLLAEKKIPIVLVVIDEDLTRVTRELGLNSAQIADAKIQIVISKALCFEGDAFMKELGKYLCR